MYLVRKISINMIIYQTRFSIHEHLLGPKGSVKNRGHSYYRINSAQTKEIMARYILQPSHILILVKAFILMLVPGRDQLLIISMCFAWRPVTSINKCVVLTLLEHVNCHINTQLISLLIYKPPREKTNNVVSEQVHHKLTCTSTKAG